MTSSLFTMYFVQSSVRGLHMVAIDRRQNEEAGESEDDDL